MRHGRLNYMLPGLAGTDAVDVHVVDPVVIRKGLEGAALSAESSNLAHVILGQLRPATSLPSVQSFRVKMASACVALVRPSFPFPVTCVVSARALKQMRRPNAQAIVAAVQSAGSEGDAAPSQPPCGLMSADLLTIQGGPAVSPTRAPSRPDPAIPNAENVGGDRTVPIDFGPEEFFGSLAVSHDEHPLSGVSFGQGRPGVCCTLTVRSVYHRNAVFVGLFRRN